MLWEVEDEAGAPQLALIPRSMLPPDEADEEAEEAEEAEEGTVVAGRADKVGADGSRE